MDLVVLQLEIVFYAEGMSGALPQVDPVVLQ